MTGELTKAHCSFIKQIGKIEETGNNPFHNSSYATLEGVLSVVNPVLAANGLSVNQTYDHLEGRTILKTHLRHISGEEIVSSALYPETSGKNKLHDWGGNCTYMRRYTLLAILGICAGIEDTDGNHGSIDLQASKELDKRNRDWRNVPETVMPLPESLPKSNTPKQEQQTIPKPADKQEVSLMRKQLLDIYQNDRKQFDGLEKAYKGHFEVKGKFSDHIQEPKHLEFIRRWVEAYTRKPK